MNRFNIICRGAPIDAYGPDAFANKESFRILLSIFFPQSFLFPIWNFPIKIQKSKSTIILSYLLFRK